MMIIKITSNCILIGIYAVTCLADSSGETDSENPERVIPTIDWKTTIEKFQFDNDKFIGQRLTVKCPPVPKELSMKGVHGTNHYPSDSAICVAALHAGKITKDGGTVTIQLSVGQKEYKGSNRNGVITSDLAETKRSFTFVDENDPLEVDQLPLIDWDTKFTRSGFANRLLIGQRFSFRCPPMPKDRKHRLVFGTDSYDFASHICQAAMHAKILPAEGGVVTVQIDGKVEKLVGSVRNGVETKSKNGGNRTISFVQDSGD